MLMPRRYDASATVSPARASTKRVTPSSKFNAMLWPMDVSSASHASDLVDVDDVVDVVVLQDDLLAADQRVFAGGVHRVEGRAEIRVRRLVAEAEGHPVEAELRQPARLLQDLDVADVVRGPRLRQARGAAALGPDAEDAVFEATPVAVPDQRDLGLRILGQPVVVVPGRHPELRIRRVVGEPGVPVLVVERAGLAVQELRRVLQGEDGAGGGFDHDGHGVPPQPTVLPGVADSARCIASCQYLCWTTKSPSSSV